MKTDYRCRPFRRASAPAAMPGLPAGFAGDPAMTAGQAIAAIDPLIQAVAVAWKNHPGEDRRPVMIHGRTLREDPVRRSRRRGSFPRLCDARR
jgi:hypothetical protein